MLFGWAEFVVRVRGGRGIGEGGGIGERGRRVGEGEERRKAFK